MTRIFGIDRTHIAQAVAIVALTFVLAVVFGFGGSGVAANSSVPVEAAKTR